ncbi:MAG TPA: TetR/AcrR family transcriptional regulator [Fluviicoccus sp.]|nr:TetR/AcrR family transcriptional regulator [Fluviicoccus sp.]
MTHPTTTVVRRTQAERSAATIDGLLLAAVESLVEVGYARTSTQDICKRAGLSQGALFRHFPSRLAFMIAVADHVSAQLVVQFSTRFRHVEQQQPTDLIGLALNLARENTRSPYQQAWVELLIAARTDTELQNALQPIWANNQSQIRSEARNLLPGLVDRIPDFDTAVEIITMFYQGEAINQVLNPRQEGDSRRTAWVGGLLRGMAGLE